MQGAAGAVSETESPPLGWLQYSIFAFKSPELEQLFQASIFGTSNSWTLVATATILVGWVTFIQKFLVNHRNADDLPSGVWGSLALHVLTLGCYLTVRLLKPQFHLKHRRAMHTSIRLCQLATLQPSWGMLLWMRSLSHKAGTLSWLQGFHKLAVENMFLSSLWLFSLGYPLGQAFDLVYTTVALVTAMSINRAVCASPRWGTSMVTTSPGPLAVVQALSPWLRCIGTPSLEACAAGPALSCPAALGFWQVVGWVVAVLTVLVADVLRRRAFLRSGEAQAYLGPAYAAAATGWPFGQPAPGPHMHHGAAYSLLRCQPSLEHISLSPRLICCNAFRVPPGQTALRNAPTGAASSLLRFQPDQERVFQFLSAEGLGHVLS
jgi:hypothetical protein